jgi:hypothetical protein
MKFICYIAQVIKKNHNVKIWKNWFTKMKKKTDNVNMKTKRWKHIRNYSIIIYDENPMEIGNKETIQYKCIYVRKMKHAIKTKRYKC